MLAVGSREVNAAQVSFADLLNSVPAIVRLVLAVAITVGISVLLVHVFHSRILAINEAPKKAEGDDHDPPPGVKDISGRLIALTTFAFVFLLGFGFGQFWSTAKDARDAVANEAIDYQRAIAAAKQLPPDQSAVIVDALEDYRTTIVEVEWPLMVNADTEALAEVRFDAGEKLTAALISVRDAKEDPGNPVWAKTGEAIDDLLSDGIDRTNALPSPLAISIVLLVFVLGLVNLFAIALFQPARKKANLVVVAMMAALTGFLLFVLVEISNPYAGAGAISSYLLER